MPGPSEVRVNDGNGHLFALSKEDANAFLQANPAAFVVERHRSESPTPAELAASNEAVPPAGRVTREEYDALKAEMARARADIAAAAAAAATTVGALSDRVVALEAGAAAAARAPEGSSPRPDMTSKGKS